VGKNEAIYRYLVENHPDLVEDERFNPTEQAVISIPQQAPEGATYRTESALHFLKRVEKVTSEWVVPGHRDGQNCHNVSATVSIKESEWADVGEWMWENRESYNGLSVLPYDGGTYVQAPFEDCSKETYEAMFAKLSNVNLDDVIELKDNTDLSGEVACAGGACEVDFGYAKEADSVEFDIVQS